MSQKPWASASWLILAALVVSAAAASEAQTAPGPVAQVLEGGDASRVERLLKGAARLKDALLLRPAAERLLEHLGSLDRHAPVSSGYHRLVGLLAEVYLESQQYELALVQAQRGLTYLNEMGDGGRLAAEQRDATARLGRIYLARANAHRDLGDTESAAKDWSRAGDWLNRALERIEEQPRPKPVWEFEVRSYLGIALHMSGQPDGDNREMLEQQLGRLETRFRRHEVSLDVFHRGAVTLAGYLEETGHVDDALRRWHVLLAVYGRRTLPAQQQRMEVWLEISRLRRKQEQWPEALAALDNALNDFHAPESPRMVIQAAQIERLRGDAQLQIGRADDAVASLESALRRFGAAIRQLKQRASAHTQAGLVKWSLEDLENHKLRLAAHLGYQASVRQLHDEGRAEAQDLIAATSDLHDFLEQTRGENDPQIHEIKTFLGAVLAREQQLDQAQPYLRDAFAFWRDRMPHDAVRLVQTIYAWGRAEQEAGSLTQARDLYEAALPVCRSRLVAVDPTLAIRTVIAAGDVTRQLGKHDAAIASFQEARQLAAEKDDEEHELLALRNLASIYASRWQLDLAASTYRQLMDRQETSGMALVLDDILALNNVYLTLGDINQAERTLRLAESDADEFGPQSERSLKFRHQRAMLLFLRYSAGRDEWATLNDRRREQAKQHREGARDIWMAQRQSGTLRQRARTHHHLGRLRYLEYLEKEGAWRTAAYRPAALRKSASYGERLAALNRLRSDYDRDRKTYDNDVGQRDLGQVTGKNSPRTTAQRRPQDKDLLRRKEDLERRYVYLKELRRTLQKEYDLLAPKRGTQPQNDPIRKDLDLMLHDAHGDASTAVRMLDGLEQPDDEPYLLYLALCGDAEILHALSISAKERDADDMPWFDLALARLESAVRLMQAQAQAKDGAAGRDVSPAVFFPHHPVAIRLCERFIVELTADGAATSPGNRRLVAKLNDIRSAIPGEFRRAARVPTP